MSEQSIFYKTNNLYKRINEFVEDVKKLSYEHRIEQKYVEGRWREPSNKTLEFILKGMINSDDLRFIRREPFKQYDEPHLEAVFLYTPKEWYLATFNIKLEHEDYFIKKYYLRKML